MLTRRGLAVLCANLAVACVALYPRLPGSGLLGRDLFSSMHLLVIRHVGDWLAGDTPLLAHFPGLAAPSGVGVTVVAWPTIVLSLAMRPVLGELDAFTLAQLLLLAGGGVGLTAALLRAGLGSPGAAVAGLLWSAHPALLHVLANGQPENLVGPWFALALWGLARGGRGGATAVGAAGVAAGLSSPYQVVPLAILVASGLLALRPRRSALLALGFGVAMVPVFAYYAAPLPDGLTPMGPGPSGERVGVHLSGLWTPHFAAAPGVTERLSTDAMHTVYLGGLGAALALVGLARARRRPLAWLALGVACGSLVLALGGAPIQLGGVTWTFPWAWLQALPHLDHMGMAYRFVTGVAFAQCIGIALAFEGVSGRAGIGLAALGALALADGIWLSPAPAPFPTLLPAAAGGYAALPADGAVLDLPASPHGAERDWSVDLDYPPTQALLHGRPMLFTMQTELPPGSASSALWRGTLDRDGVDLLAEVGAMRAAGFGYLALHSERLRNGARVREMIEATLGPADAEGGGVVGWVLPEDAGAVDEWPSEARGPATDEPVMQEPTPPPEVDAPPAAERARACRDARAAAAEAWNALVDTVPSGPNRRLVRRAAAVAEQEAAVAIPAARAAAEGLAGTPWAEKAAAATVASETVNEACGG